MSNALERVAVIALVVGLYGCRGDRQCENDTQCNSYQYCVPDLHVCALKGCEADDECGNEEICSLATGLCSLAPCNPACPSSQGCLHGECAPRYSSVTLDVPADGVLVGPFGTTVKATLHLAGTLAGNDPVTLDLEVVYPGGGVETTLLAKDGEGHYSGWWTPPSAGMYRLTAQYADAGLSSAESRISANFTPPVLTIVVPVPQRRSGDAGVADENDPDWPGSWRRDEKVPVKIGSNRQLDFIELRVYGIAVDGGSGASLPFSASASMGCAQAFCYGAAVDVSQPMMNAGRGVMQLVATASDLLGNQGTADAGLPVTRVKWVFTASTTDRIKTSPAIGQKGTIYFGTANGSGSSGGLWAVAPDGTEKWTFDGGAVEASPAVGTGLDGGTETIYFGANFIGSSDVGINQQQAIAVVMNEDGNERARCLADGTVLGSPALGKSKVVESDPIETAYFNVNDESNGSLIAARPGGRPDLRCVSAMRSGEVSYPGGLALDGPYLFYGDDNLCVRASSFGLNGSLWQQAWTAPMSMIIYSVIPSANAEIIVSGNADGDGSVATISRIDGVVTWNLPGPAAWNAVLGRDGLLFADATPRLTRILPHAKVPTATVPTQGAVKNAPLIAEGGVVYTASATPPYAVQAFSSSLEPLWSLALRSSVTASVAVDCRRDASGVTVAGLGTLYVATTGGQLYAIITDSAGIDTTAPWPKYQHDPRNTGNVGTDLSEFACP